MESVRLFLKAHVASTAGTLADLLVFWLLVAVAGLSPTAAVAASATVGAGLNFGLARHWVFKAGGVPPLRQAMLFALGALVSIALNTGVVALLAGPAELPPLVARILAVALVAAGFNFPFQRYVVFRTSKR